MSDETQHFSNIVFKQYLNDYKNSAIDFFFTKSLKKVHINRFTTKIRTASVANDIQALDTSLSQ